jgi:ketosteroid isomerase-like protein
MATSDNERRSTMMLVSFFLVSWLLLFGRGREPLSSKEETGMMAASDSNVFTEELRAVFAGWTAKWNAGDLEGYLAAYADSDQTRYCAGSKVLRGKENIAAHYRERGVSGHLTVVDFEGQAMGESDGLVFGQFELVLEDATRHTGAFTVHVRKINGLWRILSDHSAS